MEKYTLFPEPLFAINWGLRKLNLLLCPLNHTQNFPSPSYCSASWKWSFSHSLFCWPFPPNQFILTGLPDPPPVYLQHPHVTHNELHSHLPDSQLPHLMTCPSWSHSVYACGQHISKEGHKAWTHKGDPRRWGSEAPMPSLSGLAEFCVVLWKDDRLRATGSSPGPSATHRRTLGLWFLICEQGDWPLGGPGLPWEMGPHRWALGPLPLLNQNSFAWISVASEMLPKIQTLHTSHKHYKSIKKYILQKL